MKLEEELRKALREESRSWTAPAGLKDRVLDHKSMKPEGRRMKKWIAAGMLAAVLLVPTGAYAGYHYLADAVYGSRQQFERAGGTLEQYGMLEAKLQEAKQSLDPHDFAKLAALLRDLGKYNLRIVDGKGALHPERLNAGDQEIYTKLVAELEPYFAKLNAGEGAKGNAEEPVQQANNETLWNKLLVRAEQKLDKEDFTEVQAVIGRIQKLNAQATASNGGVRPFTKEETEQMKELIRQLVPYQDQLEIRLEPVK